jgi:hypothetical protein
LALLLRRHSGDKPESNRNHQLLETGFRRYDGLKRN